MNRRFTEKLSRFFSGRYGRVDAINKTLIVLWIVSAAVNIFFRSYIVYLAGLVPALIVILRMLSKNPRKRLKADTDFRNFFGRLSKFAAFQIKRIKEIKTHKYVKCPNCRSYLRFPRRKGAHTAKCPRCGHRFNINV